MIYEDVSIELQLGQIYDEGQIYKYILENNVYVICEQTAQFTISGNSRFRVEQKLEGYVHRSRSRWTYIIPDQAYTVYVVSKVKD